MPAPTFTTEASSPLRRWIGPFADRPRLMSGIMAGLFCFVALAIASHWQLTLRVVLSWDAFCLWFIVAIMIEMRQQEAEDIRLKVSQQDEGQGLILLVVLIAVGVSLVAVGLELSQAKEDHGLSKSLRVAMAAVTVGLSWFTVQVVFALHYAHMYYAPDKSTADETDVIGGLHFPGEEQPTYFDFLHFSTVIGVACQTADIEFTSRRLRKIGTVHSLMAFVFNTGVLALAINMLASLF